MDIIRYLDKIPEGDRSWVVRDLLREGIKYRETQELLKDGIKYRESGKIITKVDTIQPTHNHPQKVSDSVSVDSPNFRDIAIKRKAIDKAELNARLNSI